MKTLSVHPYYAMGIIEGYKTIECRTWKTDYRGDLVICSTQKKHPGTISGHALGVVTLEDIVPFKRKHLEDALMLPEDYQPGCYAWILTNNRPIVPQPVKGKLSLWNYTGPIVYAPIEEWVENEDEEGENAWFAEHWDPLLT